MERHVGFQVINTTFIFLTILAPYWMLWAGAKVKKVLLSFLSQHSLLPLSPPPMMCELDDSLASDIFLNVSDWDHFLDITHSFRIFSNLHSDCENELTLSLLSLQGPLSGSYFCCQVKSLGEWKLAMDLGTSEPIISWCYNFTCSFVNWTISSEHSCPRRQML